MVCDLCLLAVVCVDCRCSLYCVLLGGVTRRKQPRPGIAKNDRNNGTNKTTNKPTMLLPNSRRITLQTCAQTCAQVIRHTTHISRHSIPMNTQGTTHWHSITLTTRAHPSPRQRDHNNAAAILHTLRCGSARLLSHPASSASPPAQPARLHRSWASQRAALAEKIW